MKFGDPWIDPRILRVSPAATRQYLADHGWRPLGPAANPELLRFDGPGAAGDEAPSVLLPTRLDEGPLSQRMIDLVGEVALFEGRWAGEVITDILKHAPGPSVVGPAPALMREDAPATP